MTSRSGDTAGMARSPQPLKSGTIVETTAESLGDGADALCRIDGQPLFVAGALAGERIRARVDRTDGTHARGTMVELLEPSPERAEPACRHFGTCALCRLQHVTFQASSLHKIDRLRQRLQKRLRARPEIAELQVPNERYGQRSQIVFRNHLVGRGFAAGFDTAPGIDPFRVEECPDAHPKLFAVGHAVTQEARARRLDALLAVQARISVDGEQVAVCLVAETGRLPHGQRLADAAREAGATSVVLNVHEGHGNRLYGKRTVPLNGRPVLHDRVSNLELRLGPTTFHEPSRFAGAHLVDAVRRLGDTGIVESVVDLYCGSGRFALALAQPGRKVLGVDQVRQSIHDAEASAQASALAAKFLQLRVEVGMLQLEKSDPDVVVVDPPGAGMPDTVVEGIAKLLDPRVIVLVARDVGRLVRDLGRFEAHDYVTERVETFDALPAGRELTAVARLVRS